jgi:hypothetical protein
MRFGGIQTGCRQHQGVHHLILPTALLCTILSPILHVWQCTDCTALNPSYTTIAPGATTIGGCVCKAGLFMHYANGTRTCMPCPAAATNCTEPGIGVLDLPLKHGHWRSSNTSLRVEQCFTPDACVGGRIHDESCANGHGGPFCEVCVADFYRDAGRCIPCSGHISTSNVAAMVIAAFALVLIGMCVFRRLKAKRKDLKGAEKGDKDRMVSEVLGRLPIQKVMETLEERFDMVAWPTLPELELQLSFAELSLPPLSLPKFKARFPHLQWPAGVEITLPCLVNFLIIVLPDLAWPTIPDLSLPQWHWPEMHSIKWHLPDISLPQLGEMLRVKFPGVAWPTLPEGRLPQLSLPPLSLPQFKARFPHLQWPSGPEITLPCLVNFLMISLPDLAWPTMPDLSLPQWELPDMSLGMPMIQGSSLLDALLVKLRILISTLQVLSQLGVVYSIPYPPIYTQLMRMLSLLQFDFITVVPLACIFPHANFFFSLAARTLVLPFLASIPTLIWLWYKVRARFHTHQEVPSWFGWFLGQCGGIGFYLLFLIYPSVSANIFAVFQCEDLDDGSHWLRADFSIRCYTPAHDLMMGYAVLMALIYPLGTPLLYYVLLRRHKEELDKLRANQILRVKLLEEARARREYVQVESTASLDSADANSSKVRQASSKPWHVSQTEWNLLPPATRVELMELDAYDKKQQAALPGYIKKLLKGYELRVWWFEIFECLRKLAVACVPVFFVPSGSISQLIFGLMVCFVTFGMFIHYDPFEEGGDDLLAWLCQGQIFFSLLSSIALSYDEEQRAASRNLDVLLVTLWVLPLVLSAFLLSPISLALQTAIESMKVWLSTTNFLPSPISLALQKVIGSMPTELPTIQQHPNKEVPPPQDSLPLDVAETSAETLSILPWQEEATSVVHPRRSHLDTEDVDIEDAREPLPSARV